MGGSGARRFRYHGGVDFGYPRAKRLARRRDIDLVYKAGRRYAGRLLRLHVRPNGLPVSRLALSVPARLCNAVERNRWKRLLRESFRLHPDAVGPGLDIIAVPVGPPGSIGRAEVEAALLEILRRVPRPS
jgi:ribonuclease P protein component